MQNTQHHGGKLLRKGSRGADVRQLQEKLGRLGFDLKADGIFGDDTEKAVIQLQSMFGYTVDALVGDGTQRLIDAQLGYGWSAKAPDAAERALAAQGKGSMAPTPAPAPVQQGTVKAAPQKPAPQAQAKPPSKPTPKKEPEKKGGFPKAPFPWNR
jgi:peptidoglycan hydrolase-like protein with peptidoglycan-binding domain